VNEVFFSSAIIILKWSLVSFSVDFDL